MLTQTTQDDSHGIASQRWPKRISEPRCNIEDVSQRMFTLTLRGLKRDGLVTRTAEPAIPL